MFYRKTITTHILYVLSFGGFFYEFGVRRSDMLRTKLSHARQQLTIWSLITWSTNWKLLALPYGMPAIYHFKTESIYFNMMRR